MLLTEPLTQEVALIVARASNFAERLNNSFIPNGKDNYDIQIQARSKLWCQVVAKGEAAKFQKRLAWSGLDINTLHSLLGNVDLNESQLPSWATTLEQVIQTAQSIPHQQLFSPHRYLEHENPVAFEPVYIPCLQVAQQKLQALVGSSSQLLSDAAQETLERGLLQRLSLVCTETLMKEFSEFRSSGNTLRDFLLISIQGRNRQEKYHAFIQKLFEDGLLSFFQEYSVLGRLVAVTIDFWVEATAEFLNRLATDWFDIQQCFWGEIPLQQVVALKPDLSDPHNRGRSVITLKFDAGLQLVYKPKELGIDIAFCKLLSWCNNQGIALPFKVLQVLNCSTYGWIEYVELLPCEDERAVQRFYQRSGMLLCLIYALEGTDCHQENLIACGEQPVLVDIETLLHHRANMEPKKSDALALANQQIEESVLHTMLLPQWNILPNEQLSLDLSGFGGVEQQEMSVPKLQNLNTDAMDVNYEIITLKYANGPTLNGIPLSPKDYLENLVAGFEHIYGLLISQQADLLVPGSPLMNLAHQKVRFVFRNTRTYTVILHNSYAPNLLRSGIDRSISLDILSRAFLTTNEKPVFWSILASELQAMEELDIPFFVADSSSNSLTLPTGEVIPKIFEEASFNRMLSRIKSLSEADLAKQIEIVRGSFYSRFVREPNPVSESGKVLSQAMAVVTSQQLVEQAMTIATDLQQRAISAPDGSIAWLGMGYRHSNQGLQVQSLGYGLYDGICGVALFLAALAKVTSNLEWHHAALRTLQPLRTDLHNSEPDFVTRLTRQLGMSGATGLGSIAYALAQINQLLQEPSLLQDALKAASLITPDLIAADQTFNILEGAAGVLLSLLALHKVETAHKLPESTTLDLALACGEHLLAHQTSTDNRPRAWKTWNGKHLTGFSQGAAGIAYALLQLYAVTSDSRFLDAATEAIAYEQSVFSTDTQNWPDLRSEEPCFRVSWANGAAGVGLGRLGGLSILDTTEIRQEIAIAVETTQKFAISNVDNLCWGSLGQIETLLVAAHKLDRPDLLEFVHQAVTYILTQAKAQGTFTLFPDLPPKVYNPGFFYGATGIGYELLRIAYPTLLPSVLLWE
ncbi:type 2 lanthipeptide synthetase LanM family protein (plasmid) [Nostoc sp. UHCC 0926]|uniref:type 2 lanthipeptide synthetase LanM family protein n=1 Tax=Nostoc sp. UHCC 0926 TaxID=3025190 RepID=UPI002361AD88|nr:type 2 lanthipeptide synthetase LanM family protein [Nostoc sp. UHCC 0926]WDD36986.1 type 2 lanthipeptide synthetase LanM family protein [Nostoc sp. UHCC 0926]